MKKIWWIIPLSVILCLVVVCRPGIFQGQPVITFPNGGCLQHCADGSWKWFDDPEMRWTDGNLHLITEGEYKGGYQ